MQQWNGRRKHARFRRFPHSSRFSRFPRLRWIALIIVSAILVIFGVVKLIGYSKDYTASMQTSEALRQVAEASPTSQPSAAPTPELSTAPQATSAPTATPAAAVTLAEMQYPRLEISPRFKALRKQNKDIVGWLTIETLLDEAVTQRDEDYYMNHDALGKKNVNGAIFLDSAIDLKCRPYTLLLYGHNMKTGAMFGCLRNYENINLYHREPFITFDTLYEEGRYVIFAVGTISTEPRLRNYVDFFGLQSMSIQERQATINSLLKASVFSGGVDVLPDDQLLLLVTCVDADEERRVVAARRVRDGETEEELKKLVERSWKKP